VRDVTRQSHVIYWYCNICCKLTIQLLHEYMSSEYMSSEYMSSEYMSSE